MPITSIAWWYKQKDEWAILILDKKNQLNILKQEIKKLYLVKQKAELLANF